MGLGRDNAAAGDLHAHLWDSNIVPLLVCFFYFCTLKSGT